ncbi:MAG: 2-oxoglutarate dehydrogenase E1 component [Saprospiraceae bacterium]|jgi:2-oxoglutarate dehydrogenase E1 component|nr:2-oxoglutarate dehydrogenase E1 component [Saprospiraceae bacterium]
MKDLSFLANASPAYIEQLYLDYQRNSGALDSQWQQFFAGYDFAQTDHPNTPQNFSNSNLDKEFAVLSLIHGYRSRGHLLSNTNPIRKRKDRKPFLQITDYDLESADLDFRSQAATEIGMPLTLVKDIIARLQTIYCGSIGFEYTYIEDRQKRNWLRHQIESRKISDDYGLNLDQKKRILEKLNDAVIFEKFLHTKYVGQKRFSLEGGESLIPGLDAIINNGVELGVQEVVIGMAHRGRLNVLANIMKKTYEQLFNEFEGLAIPDLSFGSGDVKYHLGFSSQTETISGKKVQLKLAPNPSHLEAVNPVVEGLSRAKADLLYQSNYDKILPILIHGDAAIAGQGVGYETLQMSQLEGFYTGGTIHFVINNQIGFTTDFEDARSATYCTSMASLVQAPVFHVNGDDPEAVIYACELAIAYRQEFNSDVFIDMVCYRRHGHNEGDDPKFTQPEMYDIIQSHPNVRELYLNVLTKRGELEKSLADEMEKDFWNLLQERLDLVKQKTLPYLFQEPELAWRALEKKVDRKDFIRSPITGISMDTIKELLGKLLLLPKPFNVLPKINRLMAAWQALYDSTKVDWSMSELLAYASILNEGRNVRLSGQDVKRGTFSHRHAVLFDEENNEEYNRLSKINQDQGNIFIYNSLLSEFAVLGFEYGYSLATPNQLILWEAQFGDFVNGAQVIVDQFIATAELKWNRMSGLVMLLPHGYDGQGPEHSSGRLERFLQASAEFNIIVANVSTPANYFHLLRRQLTWNFRKPLVVMSPKSLLRHPKCISTFEEMSTGSRFQEIIDDDIEDKKSISKVLVCSGQIYYELLAKRDLLKQDKTAIIRIEQLYPFCDEQLLEIIKNYTNATFAWVQEEPLNMGAASHVSKHWNFGSLQIIGRPESASSAVGHKKVHDAQLKDILDQAFV